MDDIDRYTYRHDSFGVKMARTDGFCLSSRIMLLPTTLVHLFAGFHSIHGKRWHDDIIMPATHSKLNNLYFINADSYNFRYNLTHNIHRNPPAEINSKLESASKNYRKFNDKTTWDQKDLAAFIKMGKKREPVPLEELEPKKKRKKISKLIEKMRYNPNYGYESYWDKSLKVSTKELKIRGNFEQTTKKHYACGEECSYIYLSMGKICARKPTNLFYKGCLPKYRSVACYGTDHGDLNGGYVTYDNYCKFLDDQCNVVVPSDRIVFVHVGACRTQDEYFPPRYDNKDMLNRLEEFNATASEVMDAGWRERYQYMKNKNAKKKIIGQSKG